MDETVFFCREKNFSPSKLRIGRRKTWKLLAAGRSLSFWFFFVLVTVPYGVLALIFRPLPRRWRYYLISRWAVLMAAGIRILLGIRWHYEGIENLPNSPFVLLAKHQSALETIILPLKFSPLAFVLKRELLRIPFFGWGLSACPMIPIDRAATRKALIHIINEGKKLLEEGFSIAIFPEGTRVNPGERKRYHIGGAALAVAGGVPVVPLAHNSGDVWERNSWIKFPGDVLFIIGSPITSQGQDPTIILEEAEKWIEETMEKRFPWQYENKNFSLHKEFLMTDS